MISGVQCSGKTTLLQVLQKNHKNWKFKESASNIVSQKLKVNQEGDFVSQKEIMLLQLKNLSKIDITKTYIYDRGLLDSFSYATWLFRKRKLTMEQFKFCERIFQKNISSYDIIGYCEPLPLEKGKQNRSTDEQYRKEIEEIFLSIINNNKEIKDKTIFLKGNVLTRVVILEDKVKSFNS